MAFMSHPRLIGRKIPYHDVLSAGQGQAFGVTEEARVIIFEKLSGSHVWHFRGSRAERQQHVMSKLGHRLKT